MDVARAQPNGCSAGRCQLASRGRGQSKREDPQLNDAFPLRTSPSFLAGGGEMGRRMRGLDWSGAALGPPENWPQSLRTAVFMMLNTRQPMFIAWGPELAFLYNDAYAPILGARHPEAFGGPFERIWSDIWDDLLPLVRQALDGRAVWQEDMPLLMHRHGFPEETFFTFTYSPIRDESGDVAGMFCTCIETTGRVIAERQVREAAGALKASETRYRQQRDRLYALFEHAPVFTAALEGPDMVFVLANAAYRQLIGHRNVIGLPVRQALPEIEGQGLFEILEAVYRTGEPFVGTGVPVQLQRTPNGPLERRYVDFIYQPIREHDGAISGIFCQGSDITEREMFQEKQTLLLNELNHRVKNNLATVQSLAAQTARRSPDLATFKSTFEGRLIALAGAHDILTQSAWSGADLGALLTQGLDVFGDRVRLQGPPAQLNATQALALGLIAHELATNASKYGALSTPNGRVEVTWKVERSPGATTPGLQLVWREVEGPHVEPPSHAGFGSRLIQVLARGDLAGEATFDYRPDGLICRVAAPLLGHD